MDDWLLCSFEWGGGPRLLPNPTVAAQDIARGKLLADTIVTVQQPSGLREAIRAADLPQLCALFTSESLPEEAPPPPPPPPLPPPSSPATVVVAVPAAPQPKTQPAPKPQPKPTPQPTPKPTPRPDTGIVKRIVLAVAMAIIVLRVGMSACDRSAPTPEPTPTDAATIAPDQPARPHHARRETATAQAADARATTAACGIQPPGFDRLACQAPDLRALDQRLQREWARRADSLPAGTVAPLSDYRAAALSCTTPACARRAYAAQLRRLHSASAAPPPAPPPPPPVELATSAPAPANKEWITEDDYPARALRTGAQGTTSYRLVIGADGRVRDCSITASSGSAELDNATCAAIMRRARFYPARRQDGQALEGAYNGRVRWQLPE